ncbi:hypothetical protein BJ165DRAFT_1493992, partial [Panaeolus papilionaceus]
MSCKAVIRIFAKGIQRDLKPCQRYPPSMRHKIQAQKKKDEKRETKNAVQSKTRKYRHSNTRYQPRSRANKMQRQKISKKPNFPI